MMHFPPSLALNQTRDQILFGTFSLPFKVSSWVSSVALSAVHRRVNTFVRVQTIQPVKIHFCSFLTSKYNKSVCSTDWDTSPGVTSQCVYVCLWVCVYVCVFPLLSYLTTESVTNGCVRAWWSTAIALLGTKLLQDYIDSPKEKSCFNQAHIIEETKKDVQLLMEGVSRPQGRFFFLLQYVSILKKLNTEIVI